MIRPIMTLTFLFLVIMYVQGCKEEAHTKVILKDFEAYFEAAGNNSDIKWNYTADTLRIWFDEKKGDPILQVKGQPSSGKWKDWDSEMNSHSYYDSIWYEEQAHSVKGYFYEDNDFYKLLGKPPTKTLRTYSLNQKDKIKELLIYWIPEENKSTSVYLEPIVVWSLQNDSLEIRDLYPDNTIVPSRENARRWKVLLKKYREQLE